MHTPRPRSLFRTRRPSVSTPTRCEIHPQGAAMRGGEPLQLAHLGGAQPSVECGCTASTSSLPRRSGASSRGHQGVLQDQCRERQRPCRGPYLALPIGLLPPLGRAARAPNRRHAGIRAAVPARRHHRGCFRTALACLDQARASAAARISEPRPPARATRPSKRLQDRAERGRALHKHAVGQHAGVGVFAAGRTVDAATPTIPSAIRAIPATRLMTMPTPLDLSSEQQPDHMRERAGGRGP